MNDRGAERREEIAEEPPANIGFLRTCRGPTVLKPTMLLLGVVCGLAIAACANCPPSFARSFFATGGRDMVLFSKFNMEEKIDAYLWAMHRFHPPPSSLSEEVAREGRTAVPPIIARMRSAKSDLDPELLMQIIVDMADFDYIVTDDSATLAELLGIIDAMSDEQRRRECEGDIGYLEGRAPMIKRQREGIRQ